MKTKKSKIKVNIIVISLAFVVTLGIIYAAFTQELILNGRAVVRSTSWDIHFENLRIASSQGTSKELVKPEIITNSTIIADYAVTLTTPGDAISYTFDVVNNGSYPATISSVSMPTPKCLGTGNTAIDDANQVCSKLSYVLRYYNGAVVNQNDSLDVGARKTMVLTLSYNEFNNALLLANNDVAVSNLGISIVYSQSGLAKVD